MISLPPLGDAALAGAEWLLDPEAAAALIGAALAETPSRLTPSYLRHKPGRSLLVSYRTGAGGIVSAKAFATEAAAKAAAERVATRGRCATVGPVLVLPFPVDLRLRRLPEVVDRDGLRRLLGRALGRRVPGRRLRLEVVRYKPERRCLLEVRFGERQRVFVRCLTPRRAARLAARMEQLRGLDGGDLRLPVPLGVDPGRGVLIEPALPGRRFERIAACSRARRRALLDRLALALAAMHATGGEGLPRDRLSDVLARVERSAAALAPFGGQVAAKAVELGRVLRRRADYLLEAPVAALHGDLDPSQVLLSARSLTLLDHERAARGDPARDAGSFAGGLLALDLAGALAPRGLGAELAEEFVRAYRRRAPVAALRRRRVAWFGAAALLDRELAGLRAWGGTAAAPGAALALGLALARGERPTPGFGGER